MHTVCTVTFCFASCTLAGSTVHEQYMQCYFAAVGFRKAGQDNQASLCVRVGQVHFFIWQFGCGVASMLDCCRVVPGSIPDLAPTWRSLSALRWTCDDETQADFNEWRWMYVKKYKCTVF